MALELNLKKLDNESWGFRLTGGAEYDVPFTVVHVTENGVAEKGGLGSNHIIVRVNNIPTTGLTHAEVHDLLISSGNNLILAVRRDLSDLNSPVTYDEENNEEISNIMQDSLKNEELFEHERQVHFEIINTTEEFNDFGGTQVVTLAPKEIETQVTASVDAQNTISTEDERKWSTFLQKPTNPKPVVKKADDVPKGEPYRVIIKKQKKKSPADLKIAQTEESNIKEEILKKSQDTEGATLNLNNPELEEEITIQAEIREEKEITEEEYKENGDEDSLYKESSVTGKESPVNDINIPSEINVALDKLLEEKLADVQKQLEALAQLPSAIQSTIDAVTKQIASIVSSTASAPEEKILTEENSEGEIDFAEQEITQEGSLPSKEEEENIQEEKRQHSEEEFDEENIQNDHTDNEYVDTDECDTVNKNEEKINEDQNLKEDLTEEEEQARRIEQELLEKQQKEQEMLEEFRQRRLKQKPTLPLKPIERPIILPGGRRWSQPGDACPAVRHPKMSDEKIANTIETYSEVIVGKMKGINFLKYQPPPKNLDYLQRSDVYKLVHDLEPPVRGISSRVSKILSEQDYYQAG